MNNLEYQSAKKLTKGIREGKITSVELMTLFAERIQSQNEEVNAVVSTNFPLALEQARDADRLLAKSGPVGPLHGLPMTVKDCFEVAGLPCSSGSPNLVEYMPERNADSVQRLIDAGAIVFGKTNLPLFAGDAQTYNEVYGQTNNPWDLQRSSGGSSGGSAVALACGMTPLELGSDIGGSIRNPAHFCGIYGHKPSLGIVPMGGHVPPLPGTFKGEHRLAGDIVCTGPLARTAEDLELALDLLTCPEKSERKAWRVDLPSARHESLRDFRVGVWLDDRIFPTDRKVMDALQACIDQLSGAGVQVIDRQPLIELNESHRLYNTLLRAVLSLGTPAEVLEELREKAVTVDPTDADPWACYVRGNTLTYREWMLANLQRVQIRQAWADYFREIDVLLCPSVGVTAIKHDHLADRYARAVPVNDKSYSYIDTLISWNGLAGLANLPATVAPVGLASDGLPVGMQVIGPYLEDYTPIRFAQLIEAEVGGFTRPPDFRE